MKPILYQGSSKTLYQASDNSTIIMSFSDSLPLGKDKTIELSGKGVINNNISSLLMSKLDTIGIENHFIKKLNMRQQLLQFVDIVPVQVSVSNISSGRYVKDFGIEEGCVLDYPMIDFLVKNNDLNYPVINEYQMIHFSWLTPQEIKQIKENSIRIFDFLSGLFMGVGIRLIECKLEFGRVFDGEGHIMILADELTPDNCTLWDMNTNKKLGSACVLEDGSNISESIASYQMILERLETYNNQV